MEQLLEIRDKVLSVYSQYEQYFSRAIRFVVCLLCMVCINGRIGYQSALTGALPVVLTALIGALLSANGAAVLFAVIIVLHLYSLAMEAAIVGGCIFLLMLLIYFRFAPDDGMLLLLYPPCSALGLTSALPVAGGLLYGPACGITVAAGVLADRFLVFVKSSETVLASGGTETEEIISRFQYLIDGVLSDRLMQTEVIAVILAGAVVYAVRRRSIPYSWIIASAAGAVAQLVVLLTGAIMFDTDLAILSMFLGAAGAVLIGVVLSFMVFNLDYSRTETTQFEDDEYYYYVKAVPKNVYARPKRTVKTINTHRRERTPGTGQGTAQRYYTDDDQTWDTDTFDTGEIRREDDRRNMADPEFGDVSYRDAFRRNAYDGGYEDGDGEETGYDSGYAPDSGYRGNYDDYEDDGY